MNVTAALRGALRTLVVVTWLLTAAGILVITGTGALGGCMVVGQAGGCAYPVFLGPAPTLIVSGGTLASVMYTNYAGYVVLGAVLALALLAGVASLRLPRARRTLSATIGALPVTTTAIAFTVTAAYEVWAGYPDARPFVYAGLLLIATSALGALRSMHPLAVPPSAPPGARSTLITTGKWLGGIGGFVAAYLGVGTPWGDVLICMHALCSGPFGGSSHSLVDGAQLLSAAIGIGAPLPQLAFLVWLAALLVFLLAVAFSSTRPSFGHLGLYLVAILGGTLAITVVLQAWQHGAGLQIFDTSGDCAANYALCTFAGVDSGAGFVYLGFALALLGGILVLAGRLRATPHAAPARPLDPSRTGGRGSVPARLAVRLPWTPRARGAGGTPAAYLSSPAHSCGRAPTPSAPRECAGLPPRTARPPTAR